MHDNCSKFDATLFKFDVRSIRFGESGNELAGFQDLTITIASVANCFFVGERREGELVEGSHGVDNKWFRIASFGIRNLCQTYKSRPFQTL